jgi:hypothetical protein
MATGGDKFAWPLFAPVRLTMILAHFMGYSYQWTSKEDIDDVALLVEKNRTLATCSSSFRTIFACAFLARNGGAGA